MGSSHFGSLRLPREFGFPFKAMNQCNVDVVEADETLANFDLFIQTQEQLRVGWNDGVFKVIVAPGKPRAESPETIIRKVCSNIKSLQEQNIAGGYADNIYLSKSQSAKDQLRTFKEKCEVLSLYSEPTCCSETLHVEGIDGLLKHYYADVKQRAEPQCPSKKSLNYYLRRGGQLKKKYESEKKSKSFFNTRTVLKWNYNEGCSCKDCDYDNMVRQSDLESESESESESETCGSASAKKNVTCAENIAASLEATTKGTPFKQDALFYGAGIVMRDVLSQIHITKHFSLAKLENILLLNSEDHYEGISCPYAYVGYQHTFFPIHVEHASLWSINYLHLGHPKIWIIIPPRAYMLLLFYLRKSGLPLSQTSCWNMLGHKSTIVTPQWLDERQIPYKVVIQNPGEAVVLYPNAAHCGFNTGWFIAEAINFGTESWIVDGVNNPGCQCMAKSIHINMIDYVAAFRSDLLRKYSENCHIPMQRESEMAHVLHEALKGLHQPCNPPKDDDRVMQIILPLDETVFSTFEEVNPGTSNGLFWEAIASLPNNDVGQVMQPQTVQHLCNQPEGIGMELPSEKENVTTDIHPTKEVAKVIPLLKCPARYCTKEYPLAKHYQLVNHICKCHKPLVEKYKLLERLNEQKEQLQEMLKSN